MTSRHAVPFLALVATLACGGSPGEEEAPIPIVEAGTAATVRGDFIPTVRASGRVVPRTGGIARLAAPVSSRITRVHVTVGDRVRPGDPLVTLDVPLLASTAAEADAARDAAEADWQRAVRLEREGILPAREVERRAVERARAVATALAAHRAADLGVLRAPIAGTVTRMDAMLGAEVDPATPLVEVVDPRALDVELDVTPATARLVRPGAVVAIDAGGPTPLGGRVTTVSSAVDPDRRTVAVRVRVTGSELRLDQSVTATITLPAMHRAVLVPTAAIVPVGDSAMSVFVVDSAGVVTRRPVTLGPRSDSVAVVVAGLDSGQTVVTTGAFGMVEGSVVRPTRAQP